MMSYYDRDESYVERLEEEALRQNAEAEYELMLHAGGYDADEDMASYPVKTEDGGD